VNGQILRLGGDEHDFVQLLLPWYGNGSLDDAETARVEAHLGRCPRCQADIGWQRKLQACLAPAVAATDSAQPALELGWTAMRAKLASDATAATQPAARPPRPARTRSWRATPAWLRWTVGLQFAAIAGLALLVALPAPTNDAYRALGAPARSGAASVVVVFRPDANERQIREALRASDARLVDGPTVTGAYLLAIAPAQHAAALERLRRQGAVLRVDSLEAGPAP
jgi:anti-sigma factor RsiW